MQSLNLLNPHLLPKFRGAFVAAKPPGLPLLRPVPAEPGCGRALLLLAEDDSGDITPPFLTEWLTLRCRCPLDEVADALVWSCGGSNLRAHTMAEWLTRVLGAEVREVLDE